MLGNGYDDCTETTSREQKGHEDGAERTPSGKEIAKSRQELPRQKEWHREPADREDRLKSCPEPPREAPELPRTV